MPGPMGHLSSTNGVMLGGLWEGKELCPIADLARRKGESVEWMERWQGSNLGYAT
jgi:hypothetical protein